MTRRIGLAPSLLLALLLALVSLTAPTALAPHATGQVASAAEEGEELGPDPAPRDAEDNAARDLGGYDDRGVQFTWAASWILLVLVLGGVLTLLGLYELLVRRPQRRTAADDTGGR